MVWAIEVDVVVRKNAYGEVLSKVHIENDPVTLAEAEDQLAKHGYIIGRMQRVRPRLLEIFQDHGAFEDGAVADLEHRRLAR